MKQLIALLKKKPHWLASEGYWRLLQILRMAVFVPLACLGILTMVLSIAGSNFNDIVFGAGLLYLVAGVAAFITLHGSAWLIVWVVTGFSKTEKS